MNRTERQNAGIEKWKAARCKGTLMYAPGVGKTRVALVTCERFLKANPRAQVLVVVPTDYLKDQWQQQIDERMLMANVAVRVINSVVKQRWNIDLLIVDV